MKKIMSSILVFAIMAGIFAGCSCEEDKKAAKNEISVEEEDSADKIDDVGEGFFIYIGDQNKLTPKGDYCIRMSLSGTKIFISGWGILIIIICLVVIGLLCELFLNFILSLADSFSLKREYLEKIAEIAETVDEVKDMIEKKETEPEEKW